MDNTVIPEITPRAETPIETVVTQKSNRKRNFSFSHRKIDSLDTAECNGVEYYIPAAVGSSYWAIQKTLFSNFNENVYFSQLTSSVEELMKDRDIERWNKYISKTSTTVYLKGENKSIKKAVKSWEDRIIGNAKTLTRLGGNSAYGQRLQEKGFKIEFGHDSNKKPYFKMIADNKE